MNVTPLKDLALGIAMPDDWYERRDELECGMVFTSCWGIVKLQDRRAGDGTQWNALSWSGRGWSNSGATVEPGDLEDLISDPEAVS